VHHHCRLRLERRRCDARRRVGERRVYVLREREGKEEREKSGWMRFCKGGMRVLGGRWVHWWIVLGGRKRGVDGAREGRGGWTGDGGRRVERSGLRVADRLGSLAMGVVCRCRWVRGLLLRCRVRLGLRFGAVDRGIAA